MSSRAHYLTLNNGLQIPAIGLGTCAVSVNIAKQ